MTWLCIAELETPSFSFRAYGETIRAARLALFHGLQRHAKTHGLADDWPGVTIESAVTWEAQFGAAYRDYSPI